MSNQIKIKFTNNIRTVVAIALIASLIFFFVFTYFDLHFPKPFVFATTLILYPLAVMQKSREAIKASTEMKDISTEEMNRLRSIAKKRANNILYAILFYVVCAIGTGFVIAADIQFANVNIITASIISGVLTVALYSTFIALKETDEVNDFKSKVQERANRKALQDAFNKKISEASKPKS